jgi:four helix bundle protein
LEESAYWLELIAEAALLSAERLAPLMKETGELTAMFVTMVRNTKAKGS